MFRNPVYKNLNNLKIENKIKCYFSAGALLPFAIVLIIAGLLILHCGWAAHLMDFDRRKDAYG